MSAPVRARSGAKWTGVFGVDIKLEELLKIEQELMERARLDFNENAIRDLTRKTPRSLLNSGATEHGGHGESIKLQVYEAPGNHQSIWGGPMRPPEFKPCRHNSTSPPTIVLRFKDVILREQFLLQDD